MLVGDAVFSEHSALDDAVLVFLSLYYLMDMDYPPVNLIGFTVLQYYFFGPIVGDDYFNNLIEKIEKYMGGKP